MATALRRLRLKRVSLVDTPANDAARVVLFKSAEGKPMDCDCDVCKAEIGSESRGGLSDANFAAVWTDGEGRKQRKLPIHDAAHVRNALARFNQTDMPAEVKAKAKAKLDAAARKFGIGGDDKAEKSQPTSEEVNVDQFARCKKCNAQVKKGEAKCQKCGAPMDEDMTKQADGRPEEEQMDEKLKADLDAALAKIEALEKERDELTKRLDTPEEIEKRKLAALPESIRKRLEEGEAKIAKMEAEKAENESIEKVRKDMGQIPGKTEEVGRLLKRVQDVVKAEDFEALTVILKAASAQIEKGDLFREKGKGGDGNSTADTPFNEAMRLAAELVSKSKDMTNEQALQRVFLEHPELYAAYARSVSAGANADRD